MLEPRWRSARLLPGKRAVPFNDVADRSCESFGLLVESRPPVDRLQGADQSLTLQSPKSFVVALVLAFVLTASVLNPSVSEVNDRVYNQSARDVVTVDRDQNEGSQSPAAPIVPPVITSPPGAASVEQRAQGTRPGAHLVEKFRRTRLWI